MGYTAEGEWVAADVAPYIDGGRIMVPVAHASRALGAEVEWDAESRTVTVTQNDDVISMIIGNNLLLKNGLLFDEMETAAVILTLEAALGVP
jgi:hypothetical protein